MADGIIASGASSPISLTGGRADLFRLSASYLIDPASKTEDLGNDLGCLTESLTSTIQAIADATSGDDHHLDGLIFSARYQAKQVSGLSSEFVRRASQIMCAPGAATADAARGVNPLEPAVEMAQSLSNGGVVEVDTNELALLEKRIGKAFPALIVGEAFRLIRADYVEPVKAEEPAV